MLRIVLRATIVAAFCIVAPMGSAVAHAETADELVNRAEELIDGGWVRTAIPLLEEAVEKAPDNAEVHFLLGVSYFEAGMAKPARNAFENTVRLDPANWRAHYNLGAGYFKDGMWDQAVAAFLAVPKIAPQMASFAYLNAGLSRYKQGNAAEARKYFNQVILLENDGSSVIKARQMLAVLDRPVAVTATGATAAPPTTRTRSSTRLWRLSGSLGQAYDSNVFLAPDDQTARGRSDWRTVVRAAADYQMALGGRYRLRPHYDFYSRWYSSETTANYLAHRLRIRITDQQARFRPRLGYSMVIAALDGKSYLNTHEFAGRLTLMRKGTRRALWVGGHVRVFESPKNTYDYLAGKEWKGVVSGVIPAFRSGRVYGSVSVKYLDRKDRTLTTNGFRSYSYTAFEPFTQLTHPLPWWGMDGIAGIRYQYRTYQDEDVWLNDATGTPVPGGQAQKRRYDHRITANLGVTRKLSEQLTLEFSWRGQVTNSNIGNSPLDYQDRDFTRHLFGVSLSGSL